MQLHETLYKVFEITTLFIKFIRKLRRTIMNKFVVTPKEDKTVTMTIRIDKKLQEQYNELSAKTNHSRNELIGMALQYALDNMEIVEGQK